MTYFICLINKVCLIEIVCLIKKTRFKQILFRQLLYLLLWIRIPYKKWSSPESQQKSLKYSIWVHSQKCQNDLILFQEKPFSITVIQVSNTTTGAEEVEGNWFYENFQELLELTPKGVGEKMSF